MSGPVSHADFTFARLLTGEREQIAAMWRGAMLQQFALLEASTLQCLAKLQEAGRLAARLPIPITPWPCFACSAQTLTDTAFAQLNKSAIWLLRAVAERHKLRTALAHSRMEIVDGGITPR